MYLVGEQVTVTWKLPKTSNIVLITDLDVEVSSPSNAEAYIDANLDSFIQPSPDAEGEATYQFTPLNPGLYQIKLATGTADNYILIDTVNVYVRGDGTTPVLGMQVNSSYFEKVFTVENYSILSEPNGLTEIHTIDYGNGQYVMGGRAETADAKLLIGGPGLNDWSLVSLLLTNYPVSMANNNTGTWMFIPFGGTQVKRSTDNAATWGFGSLTLPAIGTYQQIVYIPELTRWFVTGTTGIAYSDDDGDTWQLSAFAVGTMAFALTYLSGGFTAGAGGDWSGNGASWATANMPVKTWTHGFWNGTYLRVANQEGTIARSLDGVSGWVEDDPATLGAEIIPKVFFDYTTNRWYACNNVSGPSTTWLTTTDDENIWLPTTVTDAFDGVDIPRALYSDSNGYIVALNDGTIMTKT